MPMDFLKSNDRLILRSTSVCLEDGLRLHLHYYEFWHSNFKYRFVTSNNGKIQRTHGKIPSRKHVELFMGTS